jgi:hypothetical protein
MSWVIGISGNAGKTIIDKVKSITPNQLYEHEENGFLIRTGGNQRTCSFPDKNNSVYQTIAVGVGIKKNNEELRFMTSLDWGGEVSLEQTRELNGHFVLIKWNKNEIKIFTDKLGLRDIYFTKLPGNVILFSTRADWIAKITETKLNFREFGSRWLLFNQISPNSIFENIERITGGTYVTINRTNNNIAADKFNWLPAVSGNDFSNMGFSDLLEKLILFPSDHAYKISLGLSGGMDSRVLLSYLIGNKKANWDTYTFGDENSPDSYLANNIITDLGINHMQINIPFSAPADCLKRITDYVSKTLVNNPASGFLQLWNYDAFTDPNEIIIDGGFGEIWRREFFNRLLIRGKNSLENNNIKGIMNHLISPRADIFNSEIQNVMLEGCNEQLENIIKELPGINYIGKENWADLFAVKTRLTNYYSHEQARLDELVLNYMPFAQPSLLENLINLRLMQRNNGRLFRDIIKNNCKLLIKYPLAKGLITHPYWFNTIQSRFWNIIRKKLKWKAYNDYHLINLINLLTPFIQDIIHSRTTREYDFYNYSNILKLSDSLKKKDVSDKDISELDWWLAFELFRCQLK